MFIHEIKMLMQGHKKTTNCSWTTTLLSVLYFLLGALLSDSVNFIARNLSVA